MNSLDYIFDEITQNSEVIQMSYSQRMDLAIYELRHLRETKYKNITTTQRAMGNGRLNLQKIFDELIENLAKTVEGANNGLHYTSINLREEIPLDLYDAGTGKFGRGIPNNKLKTQIKSDIKIIFEKYFEDKEKNAKIAASFMSLFTNNTVDEILKK